MKKNRIFLLLGLGLLLITACTEDPVTPVTPEPPVQDQPAVSNSEVVAAIEIQEVMLQLRESGLGMPMGVAQGSGRISADNSSVMRRAAAKGMSPERFHAQQMGWDKYTVFRFENDSVPPGDDSDSTVVDPPGDGDTTVVDDPGDTTVVDDPDHPSDPGHEYDTACVHEEYWVNDDGTYTYVIDYGEGCELYGEFYRGKVIETYRYENNSFFSKIEYIGFGGEDWSINGLSVYEGVYEYAADSTDSIDGGYSSSYSWQDDIVYEWVEDGVEYRADVNGNGSAHVTDLEFRISSQVYEVDYAEGNTESFYRYEVIEDLVYSYACEDDIYIWVSGVEEVEASEGNFTIDYGDGSCDNTFTITVNGESSEVNLEEDWQAGWSEEDAD